MAGIFFSGGLACNLTVNAACGIQTTGDNCPALYYPPRCNTQVDPLQMNAVISEIANAINAFGNQYDCSRLDNLKQVLNRARNICDLPAFGDAPDLDDRIAGCFDNVSSTITVQQLVNLVLSQSGTLCSLPQIGAIQDDDWLAGCIDGAARIVPFSAVKNALGGGGGFPGVLLGGQLFDSWGTGGGVSTSQGTSGREAFIFSATKDNDDVGPSPAYENYRASVSVATGGGGMFAVETYRDKYMVFAGGETTAVAASTTRSWGVAIRKNNVWYTKSQDVVVPLGGDDGVLRFQTRGYQRLRVWEGSIF